MISDQLMIFGKQSWDWNRQNNPLMAEFLSIEF